MAWLLLSKNSIFISWSYFLNISGLYRILSCIFFPLKMALHCLRAWTFSIKKFAIFLCSVLCNVSLFSDCFQDFFFAEFSAVWLSHMFIIDFVVCIFSIYALNILDLWFHYFWELLSHLLNISFASFFFSSLLSRIQLKCLTV